MMSRFFPLISPSFAEPITKAVRRNDVEHLPRDPVALFDIELGQLLLESVGLEFCEQRLEVLYVEGTAVFVGSRPFSASPI